MDDEEQAKKLAHEIGESLDSISVDELADRIGLLEAEIVRLKAEIENKKSSKAAADAVFKI